MGSEETKIQQLLEAASKGDMNEICEMVRRGADINAITKDKKRTPLMEMASKTYIHPEHLHTFKKLGAEIDARDNEGWSPLMLSAYEGHLTPELLDTYIECGADINASTHNGITPLMYSTFFGYFSRVLLNAFMKHGADINAQDASRWSPLHCLASTGCFAPNIVQAFVDYGADINHKDKDGNTPLIVFARNSILTINILEVFADCGADFSLKNDEGQTALLVGTTHGNFLKTALSFLNCLSFGFTFYDIYPDSSASSFLRLLRQDGWLDDSELGAFAILLSAAIYPGTDSTLKKEFASEVSSKTMDLLLGLLAKNSNEIMAENFLHVLPGFDCINTQLSKNGAESMVAILIQTLERSPQTVLSLVNSLLKEQMPEWVESNIAGVDSFLAKLVPYAKEKAQTPTNIQHLDF